MLNGRKGFRVALCDMRVWISHTNVRRAISYSRHFQIELGMTLFNQRLSFFAEHTRVHFASKLAPDSTEKRRRTEIKQARYFKRD